MSKKGLKLCSAGLALSIALSSAPFTVSAGALGLSKDGNFYDDNDEQIEGVYAQFAKVTAGYIGFFFGGKDADYLVLEDGSLEAVTGDVVKDGVRFAISFDDDGNVEMVQVRVAEVGASKDYSYDVYTPEGKTKGHFVDKVTTTVDKDNSNIVTTESAKEDTYVAIGTSRDIGYAITDNVKKDGDVVLERKYIQEAYDSETAKGYGYDLDAISKISIVMNIVSDRDDDSYDYRYAKIGYNGDVLRGYLKNASETIDYAFSDDGEIIGKYVTETEIAPLDDSDMFVVPGIYDTPTSIADILKAEKAKWIDKGLAAVDSDYLTNSTSSEWKVNLKDIEGLDASKVNSVEVTLKALDERFNGQIGGAIVLSSGNDDNTDHNWDSKEYWGVNDADKYFTAATDKGVVFEKVDDYTYQGTAVVDDDFAIVEAPTYAYAVVQYWGSAYGLISVEGVVIKDKDGNVLVSYDDEGIINLPVTATATSGKKAVTVQWDKVPYATKYRVETLNDDGAWVKATETDALTATISNLKKGTYTYRVVALDENDEIIGTSKAVEATVKANVENVKAVCNSSRTITLTWDAVEGATGYIVKSEDGKTKYTAKSIKDATYTVTGLTNGTQYGFKVYAYLDGEWISSDAVHKTPVGTPKNVKAVCNASQSVTLTWDAVEGATGYIVKSADGNTKYTAKSITDTTYTVTGLTNGTQYSFKVYAYTDGKWYASAAKSKTPVGTPKNVKAVCNASQSVTLTWDAVAGATGYIVKSADGKTKYTAKAITDTTYTVTGLTNGTQYSFKVYAYTDGKWYASAAKSKTPVGTPKNVKAVCNASQSITLSWDAVAGATGYIVKSADGKTKYTTKSIKDTSYTVTGLTNGTQYSFKVYAFTDNIWYASAVKSKTPVGTPKNLKVSASSKQATISWDAVAGATGYLIKSADGKTKYTAKSIKDTSYTVTGLTNGTSYKFKVYAYTDGIWYSATTAAVTPTGKPTGVKAVAGSKQVTISWNAVNGATGYIIKSADGKTKYTAKSITDTSYTIKNLTAGTQYKFKVYACVDGTWYASNVVSKTPKK